MTGATIFLWSVLPAALLLAFGIIFIDRRRP
jgi:hypothetical protein